MLSYPVFLCTHAIVCSPVYASETPEGSGQTALFSASLRYSQSLASGWMLCMFSVETMFSAELTCSGQAYVASERLSCAEHMHARRSQQTWRANSLALWPGSWKK